MHYKALCLILDGLGDKPHALLNHKTPLEFARTPQLDALLKRGQGAMVSPLYTGIPVGTHTGTAILFGLPPHQVGDLNRGPIEASGVGVQLATGDVALRCNFATVKKQGKHFAIIDRRAGRIDSEVAQLTQVLQDIPLKNNIIASIHPATQHRAIVHLRGKGLSADISDTDTGTSQMKKGILPAIAQHKKAKKTANAINQLTKIVYQRLHNHPINKKRIKQGLLPANAILSRGAGQAFDINSILNHLGLKVAVISGERTVSGLARLFNYTCIEHPRFTALTNTDLSKKVASAQTALQTHDMVYLHIKATDICSHDCDPVGKKDFIEKIDRHLKPLLSLKNTVCAVVSDHSTNSHTGRHCGSAVPAIITAPNSRQDGCQFYGESRCMQGGLGHMNGTGFLMNLLDEMGCLRQFTRDMGIFF